MKKLCVIFLSFAIFLPLYVQADDQPGKKKSNFARQHFEIGFGADAGVANDFFRLNDIFQKNLVLDMNQIDDNMSENGINLKAVLLGDFFITVKNINIAGGKWNFGISSVVSGSFTGNIPKNLATFIAEGNANQNSFSGMFSVNGALFADAGLDVSAEFGKLRVGVRPALYTPLFFVPKSGINYTLDTTEGLSLTTYGGIDIYSPFVKDGELKFGSDISFDGRFGLFSFLDLGGSISNIPLVPTNVQNRMRLTMSGLDDWGFTGQDLIDGEGFDSFDVEFTESYDVYAKRVFRPLRFDVFARYKPFSSEFFVITPNIGFSVDINEKQGFFNTGVEARLNINDLFVPYFSMGYGEGLWKHRLGFALNLRAFELGLEASLQSQTFVSSFQAKGVGVNLGIRFGW